jgi:hypothetical protein
MAQNNIAVTSTPDFVKHLAYAIRVNVSSDAVSLHKTVLGITDICSDTDRFKAKIKWQKAIKVDNHTWSQVCMIDTEGAFYNKIQDELKQVVARYARDITLEITYRLNKSCIPNINVFGYAIPLKGSTVVKYGVYMKSDVTLLM